MRRISTKSNQSGCLAKIPLNTGITNILATKSATKSTTKSAKKGRKKTVTVDIMKKALKTHNIKFSSKLKKNDLGALIKKHCLVRYCESQVKN